MVNIANTVAVVIATTKPASKTDIEIIALPIIVVVLFFVVLWALRVIK